MSSTVCTASRCMAEDAHMTLKRTHSFLTCVCVCARACVHAEGKSRCKNSNSLAPHGIQSVYIKTKCTHLARSSLSHVFCKRIARAKGNSFVIEHVIKQDIQAEAVLLLMIRSM